MLFWSVSAKLGLERVRARCCVLCTELKWTTIVILVTRRKVFDPPVWCGVASTTVFGDEEIPSLWETLSEDDIKMTGARGGDHYLCGKDLTCLAWPHSWSEEIWWPEAYLDGALTWTRGDFSPPIPREKSTCWVCIFLTHSFTFPHFLYATRVPLLP
jgi:hypothetical protein